MGPVSSKGSCAKREELQREATKTLQDVINLTKQQIEALAANDQRSVLAIDKKLEITFGAKERSFGALWEHTKEHGC